MSKKTIRIISTLLTMVLVFTALTSTVFATETKPGDFIGKGTDVTGGSLTTIGQNIITTIRNAAMIVSVVVLMILGVKYMAGSAEEKASYKKTMMPYVIGAILVFGAAFVSNLVFDFAENLGQQATAGK